MAKSSIFRALKSGRLSGARCPDGTWRIEPAELFRTFESIALNMGGNGALEHGAMVDGTALAEMRQRAAVAECEANLLRSTVEDLRRDRDEWRTQAQRLTLPGRSEPKPEPKRSLWRWLRTAR